MRAVAVGDSSTRTGGAILSDALEPLSWSQRVAQGAGWELDTFAVSGYSTAQILGLVPLEGHWDVALTCAGTNDVLRPHGWDAARFRDEFTDLLSRLSRLSDRIVVLGVVPNVGRLPVPFGYGWGLDRRVEAANRIISEVGATRGATVVIPGSLSRPLEQFGDSVHPTSYGHLLLANQVLGVLSCEPIRVEFTPTRHFLRWTRRRMLADSVKRPPRGLAGSILAAARR